VLLPIMPADGREPAWAVDTGRLAAGRFDVLEPVGPRLGPTAVLVAPLFDDELVEQLPVEDHDRRVTAVVPPSGGWQDLGSAEEPGR
jgi:5-formyltetrahydrofolate cyclo-ligase